MAGSMALAALSFLFFLVLVVLSYYHRSCTYLLRQAAGQAHILISAVPLEKAEGLSDRAKSNLSLLERIKQYAVDSIGYAPTNNYTSIYLHGSTPVLWVVTASQAFSLQPVYWTFPLVGAVSYKGFFDSRLAAIEYLNLRRQGFDAGISPVTAYSSLGWFNDPLFSGMLERGRGAFCNLIFHELFHATYYQPGEVNLNENLASFVAHKATLRFLGNDTAAVSVYLAAEADHKLLRYFSKRQAEKLERGYLGIGALMESERVLVKEQMMNEIMDSLLLLPLRSQARKRRAWRELRAERNAYFVSYGQYESLQDSLEISFNKIYGGSLKNMVRDLRPR